MPEMLDIPKAIEQAGGNPELAQELFRMLLKELPGHKDKLNQAFNDADQQDLWDQAHKLHGATAYCGVPALQQATKALEEAIKSTSNDVANKIQEVNKAIDALLEDGPIFLEQEWF
jgi:two-component system sensor histidine kinase BarA